MVGKRALVTGVIDNVGFGAALALASHGYRLVVAGDAADLRDRLVQPTSQDAKCAGPFPSKDIEVVDLDLHSCTQQSVDKAVEEAWRVLGGLDLLLCCCSYLGSLTAFLDTTTKQLEEAININFKSALMISKAVGKRMQKTGTGGSILFITSIIGTGRGLFPGAAVAGASIAAVDHLTRALAIELGKYKIRVNAIARGLHDSDALLRSLTGDARKKKGERVVPLRRWTNVEEDLTALILYLTGDLSSYITGLVAIADGGQSLTRPRMRSFL